MLAAGIAVDLGCADARDPYLSQVPEGCRLVDLGSRPSSWGRTDTG